MDMQRAAHAQFYEVVMAECRLGLERCSACDTALRGFPSSNNNTFLRHLPQNQCSINACRASTHYYYVPNAWQLVHTGYVTQYVIKALK